MEVGGGGWIIGGLVGTMKSNQSILTWKVFPSLLHGGGLKGKFSFQLFNLSLQHIAIGITREEFSSSAKHAAVCR